MNLIFDEESGELVAQCPRCKSTYVEHINQEEAVCLLCNKKFKVLL